MYSPKIDKELIPILYKIKEELGLPMTQVVDTMIREGIARYNNHQYPQYRKCPLCGKRRSKIICQKK